MGIDYAPVNAVVLVKGARRGVKGVLVRFWKEPGGTIDRRFTDEHGDTGIVKIPPYTTYKVKAVKIPAGYTCEQCESEAYTSGSAVSGDITHYLYLNQTSPDIPPTEPSAGFPEQLVYIIVIAFFVLMFISLNRRI